MANIRKSFNFRNGVQVDNDNFVVNANGLVGIGTSVPQNYLLNVYGDTRTTGLTTTRDLFVSQNAEVIGVTTVGVLTASSIDVANGVNVGGALTAATLKLANGETVDNLIGFARTTFITDNAGVGLHTTSKIGINTTTSPGASDSELSVFGNANVTGIITATTFSGNVTGDLNSSGISTFTELKVGTAITMSAGIVTATTFIGNLTGNVTGTATTATNLSNATGITTGTINDARLPDLITSNINILSGTSYFNKIGVNTTTPSSDIHVRKNIQTEIQVTSDSNASLIGLGRSESITGYNGVLRYGNTDGAFSQFSDPYSLDIMNYGTGNLNFYLNPSNIAGTTGGFYWHKENQRLMALTSAGNLGVGITNPTYKLQVNGTASVSGDVEFASNLNLTNNLILGSGGNIGINSSSPTQKLDVVGNIAATGNIVSDGNITATTGNIIASSISTLNTLNVSGVSTFNDDVKFFKNVKIDGNLEVDGNLKSTLHINVKDFGATGNGVTDDYVAITTAITAAAGKVLIFPEGVYRTSQQIFFKESNSIIRGEGDVTIKNMDGIDGRVGCAAIGNPYTVSEAYNGDWKDYPPTTNVIVENIKFDYNRSRWFNDIAVPDLSDRWNSCCLSIGNAQYVTVRNCRITDGKRQSIDITCPAGKYDYPDDSDDDRPGTLIELINMPSQPVDVNGDTIFAARFITIDNCIAEGSGDDVIATHWVSNVLIKNSLFQYTSGKGSSSNTNCIEIDDGSRNITVDNCTAFNGMGGIEVKGHPPQPSPYNIIISNTRIINCAAPFENHHTDWEERVDGKLDNAWNQLLNTWYDVDASNQTRVFNWNFPNDDLSGASDIEVYFDDTNGTEVEAPSADYTITFDANQTAASITAGNPSTSFVTFATGKAPTSTRVRIRRKFFKLSPGTEFETYTYNGESPLARGLTYSNIQIIAPQQRYSIRSSGKRNYLGTSRAFEIGAFNEVNLQNFYISDGANDTGAGVDGYRPTQGQVSLRASDNSFYCRNHGYRIGEPVRFEKILPDDGSTGIVEQGTDYWVQEITGRNRFKITSEWEKVHDTRPEYDPANAAVVPVNADGSAMLNILSAGMFHIRDGVKSLSIDGVSIDGFGRIETVGGNPDTTYDSDRVIAVQSINIVSSTRGSLFVNNYRSNDGPIKVVDGTGSWQYTGHISNVYAFQSNGSTINVQPINSTNKNLSFSNITIAGYPEGRKWATDGPCIDVISERPTNAYINSSGAGSMLTNKTTGQLLTKVTDRNSSEFLNLTAIAWAHVNGSLSTGTDLGFKRQNNFDSWDKNNAGDYTFRLANYLTFSNDNDVLIFAASPAGSAIASVPVIDGNGNCSFNVTTFDSSGSPNNPQYIRVLVFGRPL